MDINFNVRVNGSNTDYSDFDMTAAESKKMIKEVMQDIARELIDKYVNYGYNNFSIDISVNKSDY